MEEFYEFKLNFQLGKPTKNNHIYDKDMFIKSISENLPIVIQAPKYPDISIDLEKVLGYVNNYTVNDDTGEVTFSAIPANSPIGNEFFKYFKECTLVTTYSIVKLGENKIPNGEPTIITFMKIICLSLISER